MSDHLLSKSSYIRGIQCEKSLYLYRHHSEWRDKISPEQMAIFSRGNKVGELARSLFPGGVDCTPVRGNFNAAIEKTAQAISSGKEVLYEACFKYNQTLVLIDILVKDGDKWHAYEVKSSSRITNVYLQDASLQYFIIKNALPELFDISIVYVNNQYIKEEKIDLEKLFVIQSVKRTAIENWNKIEQNILQLHKIVDSDKIPTIDIGAHCTSPYPCDFMGTCWKHIPGNSIFDLSEMSMTEKMSFYNKGYLYLSDIAKLKDLKASHKIQIDAAVHNRPYSDVKALKEYLAKVQYPVYYFDIEAFMPAIPVFKGTKPYQHLPFLFSVHKQNEKNGEINHYEFIADTGIDPRKQFAFALINALKDAATILIYDAKMENQIIGSLKKDFPELQLELESIQKKIIDLIAPFENKWYYIKQMKGSNSLKNIVTAICPEIDFSKLAIGHGAVALSKYEDLQTENDLFKIIETKEALKEYCRTDTLAMVKIFEKLNRVAGL